MIENIFRIDGLFYRVMMKIWYLLLLNFLMLIFSLPLVTIGAAQTAGFTVTTRIITKNETHLTATFISSFKKNFKQSTMVWGIVLVISSILIINWNYVVRFQQLHSWLIVGLSLVTLLVINVSQYAFFYLSRFDDSLQQMLRNLLKLLLRYPMSSLLLIGVCLAPIFVMVLSPYAFVFGMYMSCFLGISFIHLLRTYLLLAIFEKVVKQAN